MTSIQLLIKLVWLGVATVSQARSELGGSGDRSAGGAT